MNIFECPYEGCDHTVEAIALEVWHRCRWAKGKQVQLERRLQPDVAINDEERVG